MQRPTLPAAIKLLNSSKRITPKAKGWLIQCPSHADKNPSLAVDEADGKVLLKCFAGCSVEAITQAAGMDQASLFTHPSPLPSSERAFLREIVYTVAPGIEHVRREYD